MEAIKQHLAAGTDVDAKEPPGGGTPLLVAATFGQVEAAKLLIEKGGAAFFCHTEIVKLLLSKGAVVDAKNIRGETPLDAVAGDWSQELEGIYKWLAELWKLQLDLERIKATRPKIAAILRKASRKSADPRKAAEVRSTGYRGSYYMNGEIHVNLYGTPEGRADIRTSSRPGRRPATCSYSFGD